MTMNIVVRPALFEHCKETYAEMGRQRSEAVSESGNPLYEGRLTKLITQDLNLSQPLYSSITNALKTMGCIVQVRRGGGGAPSVWELVLEPTEELWDNMQSQGEKRSTRKATKDQISDQRFRDLQRQIDELNRRFDMMEAMRDA